MSVAMGKEASLEGLEFDGDTVLCRVCGDKASGFHYGVHACEGCKGFFRRSIQQKIQYRPCLKNQQCNIMRVNRNRCQYCRLKKCISVGMSRDAVRFGRVPKKEKARIIEQMQKVNLQMATTAMSSVLVSTQDLVQSVIVAHRQTCDLGQEKTKLMREIALLQNDYVDCPAHMACPLNSHAGVDSTDNQDWTDFSEFFAPSIKSVVDFAKLIPGFMLLNMDDQVTLLKAATFEVLLVRMAGLFDTTSNTMMFANGKLFRRQTSGLTTSVGFLLDSMFDFAERFNKLCLSDDELALFSAVVLLSPDRPGLRQVDQVERIQNKLTESLQNMVNAAHKEDNTLFAKLLMKTTDLRTLNALHAEKTVGQMDKQDGSVEMQDSQFDTRSEDSTPSDSSSSLATHTSTSASGMDMSSMYDSTGSLSHSQNRFSGDMTPHQQQLVLKTPYGTFYREDTGYYGLVPEQPRRRCHTLDRDSQISRPRLHTIEEGTRRRYTMDREYINKMVSRLGDRLEKRAHVNSMPGSIDNSAASSPVPILEEQYAFMNQNHGDFIPISTPDSSACSSLRTSPAFHHKDTLQPYASSPNSPRPRSGSMGTEDYGSMRPRCASFHVNSEGRAAQGHQYTSDHDFMMQDGQQVRMSADMRRGSVGASYNLHARKKSLLVDRHPAYLSHVPDSLFRKSEKQRSPLATEDSNKHKIGSSGSAFEQVPRLTVPNTVNWGQLRSEPHQEPPKVSVTAPTEEPQVMPVLTAMVSQTNNSSLDAGGIVISAKSSERNSPEGEGEMYHKKFDKLRKHMILQQQLHDQQYRHQHHSAHEETKKMENLSLHDGETMCMEDREMCVDTEYYGVNSNTDGEANIKTEKTKKSAIEAHPQILAQLKTGPQFKPVIHPAFPSVSYQHPHHQQLQQNAGSQNHHFDMSNKRENHVSPNSVVLSVPQTPFANRTPPNVSPVNTNASMAVANSGYTMSDNQTSPRNSEQYVNSDHTNTVSHLKDKIMRKYPSSENIAKVESDHQPNFTNGQPGAQCQPGAQSMVGNFHHQPRPRFDTANGVPHQMVMYPHMYMQQATGFMPQYNQHLAGMQQMVYGNPTQQAPRRSSGGDIPLNLAQGPMCSESLDRPPMEFVKKIKEEVIS